MSVLVLGTAQWGDAYGVTNAAGRLDDAALSGIVEAARESGVAGADTAMVYGDAQARLRPWAAELQITTKVSGAVPGLVELLIAQSLDALGRTWIDACLIHDWDALDGATQVRAAHELEAVRASGMVRAVGVSVYDTDGLSAARRAFTDLDVVQVPTNALDRRLDGSAVMTELSRRGTRVQARSVFLQGFLADSSAGPTATHPDVRAYHQRCQALGVSGLDVALDFIKGLPWVTHAVVGVTDGDELRQIAASWQKPYAGYTNRDWASEDVALLDPRQWS